MNTIYLVGTADSVCVDPPGNRMGGPIARQRPHATLREAEQYKASIERAFCVPLVIRKAVLTVVEPSEQ